MQAAGGLLAPGPRGRVDSLALYCNLRSLAFSGLLGFLIRQLNIKSRMPSSTLIPFLGGSRFPYEPL